MRRSVEPSDHSLLRRLRSKHPDAATQIYVRYARRLHALAQSRFTPELARRIDADDIVQSVFRRFFERARRGYYEVPPGEELWKLLLVIALNKIRAEVLFHRAAKRDVRLTATESAAAKVVDLRSRDAPKAYLQLVMEDTLERLPPLQRSIADLRIEGYEVSEIADKLHRSKRTVERVLQTLRKKLTGLLHEHQQGD